MYDKTFDDLIVQIPAVYQRRRRDTPYALFGFQCDLGWYNILYRLGTTVNSIISGLPENAFYLAQVKEKFGGLRWYYGLDAEQVSERKLANRYISEAVRKAEAESFLTCEICGTAGSVRPGFYRKKTLCDEHVKMKTDPIRSE